MSRRSQSPSACLKGAIRVGLIASATVSVGRLAWACCIGKAFRIAENRVNRNARHCTPENHIEQRYEIGAKPNEARHRHAQTEGKHAEENTSPQKLSCSLVCNLACG